LRLFLSGRGFGRSEALSVLSSGCARGRDAGAALDTIEHR
jgi:hypothetical protein